MSLGTEQALRLAGATTDTQGLGGVLAGSPGSGSGTGAAGHQPTPDACGFRVGQRLMFQT